MFVVVAAAHADTVRGRIVGADGHVAEPGVLQPEITLLELIRADPATEAERQRLGRHDVHLPDEPVARTIRDIVVPHRRLLMDLDERRFVQAGTAPIAVFVTRVEVHPPEPDRVGLELQHVLVRRLEDAKVVCVVVVGVCSGERHELEAAPRGVGIERVAGVCVLQPAHRSCSPRPTCRN